MDKLQFLTFLAGVGIPLLVAIVTKSTASKRVKSILNALISLASGLVIVAIDHGGSLDAHYGLGAFYTWVSSIATYYGLLKPTGTSEKVSNATSGFGVG